MTDKEKINSVFRKIAFFRIFFLLLQGFLIYSMFKHDAELSIAILSCIVMVLITLFINLWEAINQERL